MVISLLLVLCFYQVDSFTMLIIFVVIIGIFLLLVLVTMAILSLFHSFGICCYFFSGLFKL